MQIFEKRWTPSVTILYVENGHIKIVPQIQWRHRLSFKIIYPFVGDADTTALDMPLPIWHFFHFLFSYRPNSALHLYTVSCDKVDKCGSSRYLLAKVGFNFNLLFANHLLCLSALDHLPKLIFTRCVDKNFDIGAALYVNWHSRYMIIESQKIGWVVVVVIGCCHFFLLFACHCTDS